MSLLVQVCFGSTYATFFHSSYIWANMGGLNLWNFFSHFLPIPFFVFGFIDSWILFCNFISMLCIVGAGFSGGLFIYHTILLLRNQTTHERNNSINDYNLKSWRLNLIEGLGSNWPMTLFISPLIDSKLPGDGINFPMGKRS